MMYRCKICSEHYLSTESLQDHQFASHTQEALEAFGITKQTVKVSQDWQTRSNESKTEILHSLGYTPSDIQTLISLEFYQFGSKVKKEIGEVLYKSTPIKQRAQAVESDENKTYQNMYDSYLQARSAQIKKPFQDGATESKANEDASDQCPYCEGEGCEDCLQTGLVDGKLRDVRYPELKEEGGNQNHDPSNGQFTSEEASEDCPKCGHVKGSHSSPASGDTICYGSSDCTCAMTFPPEGESKSNEKEELLSDIIAKINKKYGGDEEQEEEGESVTNDTIITQSDGQRMFECPVCGIYVNLDKSTTYDTLKLHLSGSHNVMKWTDEDMKSLSGEAKASEYGNAIHSEDGNGWDQGGFFFGIPNMTRDDYEGTVYWKGKPVEHYDHDYFGGDGFEQDMEHDARELAEKCKDLESRGITPTTSSILSGEAKASEVSDLDKEGIFKLLTQMNKDYTEGNFPYLSVSGYGFMSVEKEFPHLTKEEINKTIDDWYNTPSLGESKASEAISEDEKDEIFQYLFDLQESGATNMFGSGAYVERDFPHLDKKVIDDVIQEWMSNWDSIAKRMGIESTSVIIGETLKTHTDYHKLINSTLSGETSIECSKCAKKFKAQENLDIHYNDSHADSELKSLIGELKANEEIEYTGGDYCDKCGTEFEDKGECKKCNAQGEAKIGDWDDDRINISVMGDNGEFKDVKDLQKEDGEAMVEDIVHKTDSGVDITHPQDEWCELCEKPTTSFEVSDDDYDEKVEDLMKDEGVDEITDFDEEEKKDFFDMVDDIKTTDEEQTEDGEAVGLSNNWDDDEKRMDGDAPQVEDNPYPTYIEDARDQMQNDIKDLSNPYDLTTDIKGKPWQQKGESLTEEQELQQARESLAPLNKLDDEKSNVTKAFESGASAEDIYSKVGDTTQDRGSEDDLTDIYNKVDVKLNLEKV